MFALQCLQLVLMNEFYILWSVKLLLKVGLNENGHDLEYFVNNDKLHLCKHCAREDSFLRNLFGLKELM